MSKQELGDRILSLRRGMGYSQEKLAQKVGVTRQAVISWEKGQVGLTSARRKQLAEFFRVPEAVLEEDYKRSTEADLSRFGGGEGQDLTVVRKEEFPCLDRKDETPAKNPDRLATELVRELYRMTEGMTDIRELKWIFETVDWYLEMLGARIEKLQAEVKGKEEAQS